MEDADFVSLVSKAKDALYRLTNMQMRLLVGLLGNDMVQTTRDELEKKAGVSSVKLGGAIRNFKAIVSRKGSTYQIDRGLLLVATIVLLSELIERVERLEGKVESLEKELRV